MDNFKLIINDEQNTSSCVNIGDYDSLKVIGHKKKENTEITTYEDEKNHLMIKVCKEHIGSLIRQVNNIKNTGLNPIKINRFSSAYVENVGVFNTNNDIIIHYCNNCWQGEGQWVSARISDFGIYPVAKHKFSQQNCHFSSIGSWSTSRYYPLFILEDFYAGKSFLIEHEGGFNWEFEIGTHGDGISDDGCLCVEMNSLNENSSGAFYLQPGEDYETSAAVYGECKGGFKSAVSLMIDYKRNTGKILSQMPVCYNDFMNSLWGKPTAERLIPLIDAAADVGTEVFCIDAGWFLQKQENSGWGDWQWDDLKFGKYGFCGIIRYINKKNMKPGIWLELENCSKISDIAKLTQTPFLTREGNVLQSIINDQNATPDLSDENIREYLLNVVDRLYDIGIRYIKNDYNHTIGIGSDNIHGCSYGLMKSYKAFCSLIDEIYRRHPDIIIENCGSGAMRCDNETLRHFDLQSISDQEIFYYNPSIINGMMAVMPIEKMGIWSYPMPLEHSLSEMGDNLFKDKKYVDRMSDGEETVFNMINAMFGIMYLSGRLDKCDEVNHTLVKEGIELYKKNRKYLIGAKPLFVSGMFKMNDKGVHSLCIADKHGKRIMAAVYRINTEQEDAEINLKEYIKGMAEIAQIYPQKKLCKYSINDGIVNVKLEKNNTARLFEIKIN